MANRLDYIVDAIRRRDYTVATESIAQVLQQKVEHQLALERHTLGKTLVREAPETVLASVAKFNTEDAKKPNVKVVKSKRGRGWDIEVNGEVIEGGFFERDAAEEAAEAYRDEKDIQVTEDLDKKCKICGRDSRTNFCKSCRGKFGDDLDYLTPKELAKIKAGGGTPKGVDHGFKLKEAASSGRVKVVMGPRKGQTGEIQGKPGYDGSVRVRFDNGGTATVDSSYLKNIGESFEDDASEHIVRHKCKECGHLWMGPAYEDECPKCFARQF